MVCPHSSARALTSFVQSNSQPSSATAKALYSTDGQHRWAYLRIGEETVPTLGDDGSRLDFVHQNKVGLLLYEKRNGSTEQTFWSHRFDKGALISTGDKMRLEGVDNMSAIEADVSGKNISLVQMPNGADLYKDVIWTNTILMENGDVPKSSDLASFRAINEQFVDSLPAREISSISNPHTLFITTAKTRGGMRS